jgi:serine/threonine protein kinase
VPRLLSGRFEIKEELGKGAHGKIYLGRDKHLKQ